MSARDPSQRFGVLRPLVVTAALTIATLLWLGAEGRDGQAAPLASPPLPSPVATAGAPAAAARDGGSESVPDRARLVRIQIVADPPQKAHVYWGIKDLGVAPLELERPRGSGPLDLILRAPGFMVVHTRAFTEHDDKVVVHLIPAPVPPAGAPPPASAGPAKTSAAKASARGTSTAGGKK